MATTKQTKPQVSSVADFKKKQGVTVELPSGFVVKVRHVGGLRAFLGSGAIPNNLLGIITKALNTGQGMQVRDLMNTEDGAIDLDLLNDMSDMLDNITMKVIVDPIIHPAPATEEERSDEMLYIDELPEDDKMFIYSWAAGGVSDLEQFRSQLASGVDAVQSQLNDSQGS